jgi:hypothetical protein
LLRWRLSWAKSHGWSADGYCVFEFDHQGVDCGYKPSFVKFLDLSMKQLLALRTLLKKLSRKELGELKNADRKKPGSVWKILRCVYGLMDSGLHWSDTFTEFVTGPTVQCKALTIAPCIFWRDVPWDDKRLTLIKFTDDLAWNGSTRTKGFFA